MKDIHELPLAERMRQLEAPETGRRFQGDRPIYARMDGRSFSNFTRGMDKPFDERMSRVMRSVAAHLLRETGARCAYTQSDEISLVLMNDPSNPRSEPAFGGRVTKLIGSLAAMATGFFVKEALTHWPEACDRMLPGFDARVVEIETRGELVDMFRWRALDCERNAINGLGQAHLHHRMLQGTSAFEVEALLANKGVLMSDMPGAFRYGVFLHKRPVQIQPGDPSMADIPEQWRPDHPVERAQVVESCFPMARLANAAAFLLDGVEAEFHPGRPMLSEVPA